MKEPIPRISDAVTNFSESLDKGSDLSSEILIFFTEERSEYQRGDHIRARSAALASWPPPPSPQPDDPISLQSELKLISLLYQN